MKDLPFGGDPWDPKHAVHIRRELVLSDRLGERVTLTNYLAQPLEFWLELSLACDFADIFEVRGWRRAERGQFFAPEPSGDRLLFRYRGRDGRTIGSVVRFLHPPDLLTARAARWDFTLASQIPLSLEWEVFPEDAPASASRESRRSFDERRAAVERHYRTWRQAGSRWTTNVPKFDVVLRRATDDLRALYMEVDHEDVISAGIPWYSTVFGRDSIITSLETLALNPGIARDTLRYLARRQGAREDPFTEEQPGRILHELRRGEMARAGEIPHIPYFGTVDATPLWLVLLHETWRWTGDEALVTELMPNAERALEWIDRYGDVDGDGFVEYARTSAKGLVNQGWKDSGDGVPFPDGTPARAARSRSSRCRATSTTRSPDGRAARALRRARTRRALRGEAAVLRAAIRRALLGARASAPSRSRSTGRSVRCPPSPRTPATCSGADVPDAEQAARGRATRCWAASMFSGWGIRTLERGASGLQPDELSQRLRLAARQRASSSLGLALYGRTRGALTVPRRCTTRLADSDYQRLPELFCGHGHGHATCGRCSTR